MSHQITFCAGRAQCGQCHDILFCQHHGFCNLILSAEWYPFRLKDVFVLVFFLDTFNFMFHWQRTNKALGIWSYKEWELAKWFYVTVDLLELITPFVTEELNLSNVWTFLFVVILWWFMSCKNCIIFVFIFIFHCKNHTRTLELEIESGRSEAQWFDLQVDLLLELVKY